MWRVSSEREEEVWSQSGVSPGDKKHGRVAVSTRTMSEGGQKGPGRICNKVFDCDCLLLDCWYLATLFCTRVA